MQRVLVLAGAGLLSLSVVTAQQMPAGPSGGTLTVTPVQGNVYMISGADVNLTVEIGRYGPILVDTPPAALVPQLLAEIGKLSPKPIRFFIHTTAHPDYLAGDAALLATGRVAEAMIHNNLYTRLLATRVAALLPSSTVTFTEPTIAQFNSEPIVLYRADPAITDSDVIVLFRGSDVISTGPIYTPGKYPVIDLERGGTIDGVIGAVYKVLDLAVPDNLGDVGTLIIPGRGRLAEASDLGEYRNMLVIITERIRNLRSKGMTLDQIKANRPSLDYDTEYHATQAEADRFVESIYRTMPAPAKPAAGKGTPARRGAAPAKSPAVGAGR